MEWLMARLSFQVAAATADKDHRPKWRDYIRFHDMPQEPEMSGADLAKMYGAVRKPNGK